MTVPYATLGDELTATERRVAAALCVRGETNKELAAQFVVEEQTIKFHMTNLIRKSGAANRTAPALWWIRTGQYQGEG